MLPYGLSDKSGRVEFTYCPMAELLSGYKNNDDERAILMHPDHIVRNYYDPECAESWKLMPFPSIFLYLPRFIGEPLLHALLTVWIANGPQPFLVDCELRRLSDALETEAVGPRIDVLKIDVEGAELDVLRGITKADWAKVQLVAVEVHENAGHLAPVRAILLENGWVVMGLLDLQGTRVDLSLPAHNSLSPSVAG